jgi:hypothetical protein
LHFNLFEKIRQGGLITGVPRHHFIGQGETLRRNDQPTFRIPTP